MNRNDNSTVKRVIYDGVEDQVIMEPSIKATPVVNIRRSR